MPELRFVGARSVVRRDGRGRARRHPCTARSSRRRSTASASPTTRPLTLAAVARPRRRRPRRRRAARAAERDPDRITFIVDRNLNYTNICVTDCDFCAFYRTPGRHARGLPAAEAGDLQEDRGDARASAAPACSCRAATTRISASTTTRISSARSRRATRSTCTRCRRPRSSTSRAARSSRSRTTLTRLRDAGPRLDPGRRRRDPRRPRARRSSRRRRRSPPSGSSVMRHAHRLGMSTTATMMYGHVETLEERVEHMRRIRELQDETRGFRAFISWTFQRDGNRLGDTSSRRDVPDVVRLPAHAGRLAHLPRQRRPHPVVVGDAGDEDRPGRARASAPTTWAR